MASASGFSDEFPSTSIPTSIRLGVGHFVDPEGDVATGVGWQHFLEAVSIVEPQVLADLYSEPLEHILRAWREIAEGAVFFSEDTGLHDGVSAMLHATSAWDQKWNLHEIIPGWLPLIALSTVFDWAAAVQRGEAPKMRFVCCEGFIREQLLRFGVSPALSQGSGDQVTVSGAEIHFPPMTWDPNTETRDAATDRVLRTLTEVLRSELDRIEVTMYDLGAQRTPIKRTGHEHFLWLARYQVKGESFASIAHSVHRSRQSVKEAIHDTAELLGLVLREPDPPGRPRRLPKKPRTVRIGPRAR